MAAANSRWEGAGAPTFLSARSASAQADKNVGAPLGCRAVSLCSFAANNCSVQVNGTFMRNYSQQADEHSPVLDLDDDQLTVQGLYDPFAVGQR